VINKKALTRLAFLGAALAWLILILSDVTILFSDINGLPADLPAWLPRIMFGLYVVCLFYYYKFKIEHDEALNFTDLLWSVFASGLVFTVISLAVRLVIFLLGTTTILTLDVFKDIIYQINFGLWVSFLLAAFIAWKRLILYQKSKWLIRTWHVFELSLLGVLAYDSLNISISDTISKIVITLLALLALVLSANMKWVAYLNFKQKWTSLLLLLLTFFYVGYFFYTVMNLSEAITAKSTSYFSFQSTIFNPALFSFVVTYSVFSFLVILFNLPTSSVFEQKLEEVVNFQRISQSIQTEQNEESVYNILLESSVSSVSADAAWLEIEGTNKEHRLFTYRISEKEAGEIRDHVKSKNLRGVFDQSSDKTKNLSRHLAQLKSTRYRSILSFPITVKEQIIGTLTLLKELPEGFNKEMTRIVATFSNQAGISIENFRLLEEAFQNERYKEELKIAKTVQKSLLPERLEKDNDFEIAAFSESADEVGGDYYDTIRINNHQVALIIADVSGKGTTAAFHMSQMKGIFHSLAQQELDPKEFMVRANQALVYCLERGSFISATYFVINTEKKKIFYARAGHCPVLYYSAKENTSSYLKDRGKALGMIKSKDYCNHVETNELAYFPGDIMVLYTDGITEAKDPKGEEFGLDMLNATLLQTTQRSAKEIEKHLIGRLYEYTGTKDINDDYTTMIVKFANAPELIDTKPV
jgi:serine phosphatase RsbU (regulator of sigma subunit)